MNSIRLFMRVPLYSVIEDTFSQHFPKTKRDRTLLYLKQGGCALLSVVSGFPISAIGTHAGAFLGSLVKQPSTKATQEIKEYYNITTPLQKESFDWKAALFSGGITSTILANFYLNHAETISQYDSLPDFAKLGLFGVLCYEFATSTYFLAKRFRAFQTAKNNDLFKGMQVYYTNSTKKNKEITTTKAMHLLKKKPQEGLAEIIKQYYDEDVQPSPFTLDAPEKYLLHYFWKDATAAFVNSLIGLDMSKYRENFFEKAVEDALGKKDLSTLSLLALYEYKETGSTNLLQKQIELVFEDKKLQKDFIGTGMFTKTHALTYGSGTDAISMTLFQKVSNDAKRLQDKYDIHTRCKSPHIHPILDITHREEASITTELRIRKPLLAEVLNDNFDLWEIAYNTLGTLEDVIEQSEIPLTKLSVMKKYGKDPLLDDLLFFQTLEDTEKLYHDFGEYKPDLDFHSLNLVTDIKLLTHFDIENKGSAPKIKDIMKFLHFNFEYISPENRQRAEKLLLRLYQEEINKDDEYVDKLKIQSLGLDLYSFLQARRTPQGFNHRNEAKAFLNHCANQFSTYAQNSYAPNLAKNQLEIIQLLLKSV